MAGKPLFSQAGCLVYEIWNHIVFTPMKTHFIACSLAGLCLSCFGRYGFGRSFDAIDLQAQEAHTIILSPGRTKPPAFLYAASTRAEIRVGVKEIEQSIQLQLRIVQGQGETVSLGLGGPGDVIDVRGESIASWAVRTADSQRYLDLQLKPAEVDLGDGGKTAVKATTIRIRSKQM